MSRPYYRNRKKGEAQTYITKSKFKARSYIGYCKNNAEKVFIHISHEGGMYGWDFFFQIQLALLVVNDIQYILDS